MEKPVRIFNQMELYNSRAFHFYGKIVWFGGKSNGLGIPTYKQTIRYFIKELGASVTNQMVKWYSDNSVENEKRWLLLKVFLFSEKFPVKRTIPFDQWKCKALWEKQKASLALVPNYCSASKTTGDESVETPKSLQSGKIYSLQAFLCL